MSRDTAVPSRLYMRPRKHWPACISAQSDRCLRRVLWIAKDPKRLSADSEDSDQPTQMRRLIRVFAGRICDSAGNIVPQLCFCGLQDSQSDNNMITGRNKPFSIKSILINWKPLIFISVYLFRGALCDIYPKLFWCLNSLPYLS